MAFNRKIKLVIGIGKTGTVISALNIDFKVERSITLSENNAEFTIYNASENTRKKILKQGNNIIFKVGYDDEPMAVIFIGCITEAISEKNGVNWVTKITAVCNRTEAKSLNVVSVSSSYTAGTLISKPLQEIANGLGLVINGIENAQIPLVNGWVFVGTANGALRYLENILIEHSVKLYIDINEIIVYKIGKPSRYSVVRLAFTGGLLSVADVTKPEDATMRVTFTSLIIPSLQANSPVNFHTDKIKGTFIVEKLNYEGDNYGGTFIVRGECAA